MGTNGAVGPRKLDRLRGELTPRQHALLRSLSELHFVTTRQLERLHFQDGGLTPLSATRTATRTLEHLHRAGLADRLDRRIGGSRAGSASFVWHLSPAGARLLDLPTRKHRYEPGLSHLAHVLEVADIVVRVHECCRTDAVELLRVEAEPTCWRRYLTPQGHQRWLKPDLAVILGVGAQARHWFLEVDRATEDIPRLQRKMGHYLAAWNDGGIEAAVGVFPGVLWIVPNSDRRRAIEAAISKLAAPAGMVRVIERPSAIDVMVGSGSTVAVKSDRRSELSTQRPILQRRGTESRACIASDGRS